MIDHRKAASPEMRKSIQTVRKMTGGMGFDENMGNVNWRLIRLISNFGYQFMPKEKGVKFSKTTLAGVKAEVAVPERLESDNIILYLHGGGFVSGGASASRGYCSMLAKYAGCRVVALDYSLAPEKPYPAAINDCHVVYQEILKKHPLSKVALIGESAGGNLCLALTHRLTADGAPKPASVVVHSPFVDFTNSLDRSFYEIHDFTVKPEALSMLGGDTKNIYVGKEKATNPDASPLFGDFAQFPPLFITCDCNETLYADALAIYKKCEEAGRDVRMVTMQGAFHAFATLGTGSPETKEILLENVRFIRDSFAK